MTMNTRRGFLAAMAGLFGLGASAKAMKPLQLAGPVIVPTVPPDAQLKAIEAKFLARYKGVSPGIGQCIILKSGGPTKTVIDFQLQ